MKPIILDGHSLTIEDVIMIARNNARVEIGASAIKLVEKARELIKTKVANHEIIYAVTTGFGANADKVITDFEEAKQLQKNLLRSHACGVGPNLPTEVVRAALCIRLNTLLAGYSGIQVATVELLRDMLNKGVHPIVPSQGSVGSSGDLCPLSHMALALIGEGQVEYKGNEISALDALKRENLTPVDLLHKEGIALNNGTSFMTAIAALVAHDAYNLLKAATLSASLTAEALCARTGAFDDRVHQIRKQDGQIAVAQLVRAYTKGSTFMNAVPSKVPGKKSVPQDAYSIRCIPQVHGASLDSIEYITSVVAKELNAVVDNPIIFSHEGDVISAGNFHGQPIALVMDFLKVAIAELGNIAERRIAKLVDPATNDGLPAFLVEHSGLNSGFMIPQYVAAALVSENKVLAHPASVDSIPTSANVEDHVSMGTIAARQAREILGNVKKVIVIEMMTAAQAVDLRKKNYRGSLGEKTAKLYDHIRQLVDYLENDRVISQDIARLLDAFEKAASIASR